jgi:hypothetical protein
MRMLLPPPFSGSHICHLCCVFQASKSYGLEIK